MSFVIVSADVAGNSPHQSLADSIVLHDWLDAQYADKVVIPVHQQTGGRGEMAYLVLDVSRFEAWDIWLFVMREFGQESILFTDDGDVTYRYFDRKGEDGGRDDEVLGEWTLLRMGPPPGDWISVGTDYMQVRPLK